MELGIGANADVGFAWSGGGDGAGAGRAQPATGSSTTDRKICSTYSGGALPRSRSAAAAAALNDHQKLADLTMTRCPHAPRARRSPIPGDLRLKRNADRPAGRRCGCWSTSPLLFSGLLFADSGRTMELGSAPMLTSASPGRAAAMVPAPVERSSHGVIDNRSENLQHLQWGRSPSLAQRCGGCGTERSSEIGRFNHDSLPSRARARRSPNSRRALRQTVTLTDRLVGAAAAGRRRHTFSGLLFADSGRRWSSGSAPS